MSRKKEISVSIIDFLTLQNFVKSEVMVIYFSVKKLRSNFYYQKENQR